MRIILILFSLSFYLYGATRNCPSASYSQVDSTITAASAGDIINIPADTATWASRLEITKGVTIIGSGKLTTVITSSYAMNGSYNLEQPDDHLITYNPAVPANNETFRLSGITIDMDDLVGGIHLRNRTSTAMFNNRIDNCIIKNSGLGRAIVIYGTVYGVIDNNTLSGNAKDIDCYGLQQASWDSLTFTFGTDSNMYYEDNTIITDDTPHSGGKGGRYCSRFNTYTHSANINLYPCFDMHGNQTSGDYACMGGEIYGNELTSTYNKSYGMYDQRGGKAMIWGNNIITTGGVSTKAREETADSETLPATGPNGQPQHVSSSYYWNNTKNSATQILAIEDGDCCDAIAEDSEYFNYNASFDGSAGIGVGLFAAMPESPALTGAGYWATDKGGDWNKTNAFEYDGALYVWDGDSWELYYTPYAYPHPLRAESASSTSGHSDVKSVE